MAKVITQPSGDEDKDTTAQRVGREEPWQLAITCRVERTSDLLHRVSGVAQASDGEELRWAYHKYEDRLLQWWLEPRLWGSGCGTTNGASFDFIFRALCWLGGRRHDVLCKRALGRKELLTARMTSCVRWIRLSILERTQELICTRPTTLIPSLMIQISEQSLASEARETPRSLAKTPILACFGRRQRRNFFTNHDPFLPLHRSE